MTGDRGTRTLDAIPDGEIVTVFEDYGQTAINVMRDNGQLRTVERTTVRTMDAQPDRGAP